MHAPDNGKKALNVFMALRMTCSSCSMICILYIVVVSTCCPAKLIMRTYVRATVDQQAYNQSRQYRRATSSLQHAH